MTLLSFSLNRDKVESGAKPHTIRFRKYPPRIGEDLFLWWKSRTKERNLMGVSVCQRVDKIIVDSDNESILINDKKLTKTAVKKFTIADGFDNADDFWLFFPKPCEGSLIWWNPDHISQRRILPRVRIHGEFKTEIVKQPIKPYYPSNGSEGSSFDSEWCDRCSRQKNCFVFFRALIDGNSRHWIYHEGSPACTAFTMRKETLSDRLAAHHRQLEKNGQLNLFSA
jgi:hypothetical protein